MNVSATDISEGRTLFYSLYQNPNKEFLSFIPKIKQELDTRNAALDSFSMSMYRSTIDHESLMPELFDIKAAKMKAFLHSKLQPKKNNAFRNRLAHLINKILNKKFKSDAEKNATRQTSSQPPLALTLPPIRVTATTQSSSTQERFATVDRNMDEIFQLLAKVHFATPEAKQQQIELLRNRISQIELVANQFELDIKQSRPLTQDTLVSYHRVDDLKTRIYHVQSKMRFLLLNV